MKFMLMPKESSWWIWLATDVLLVMGLVWTEAALIGAIVLSVAQAGIYRHKHRSFAPYPVQIRVAYTALLLVCFTPFMRWLYWLPTVGTCALVLFGYCLMARMLSLAPWNRRESLTVDLFQRTFCTAPVLGRMEHGLPAKDCPGGVCEREARIATLQNQKLG